MVCHFRCLKKGNHRCIALRYKGPVSLLGGTAPLFNTYLIDKIGLTLIPAFTLIGGAILGLLALYKMRDSTGKALQP